MNIEFNAKVQALFQFEVRGPDGEIRRESGWSPNLVLDQGLELIGTGGCLNFCQVGSGVSTPLKTDKNLEVFVGETTKTPVGQIRPTWGMDSDEGFCWTRKIFRFEQGQAVGNISEVGVGGTDKGGTKVLFNRALIRDAQGFFATVAVMEDETLDVTVELRIYLDPNSRAYTVNMSGVEYSLRTESIFVAFNNPYLESAVHQFIPSGYSGAITSKTATPSGAPEYFTGQGASYSTRAYVPGSKKQIFDMYWGLNVGNSAPLRTVIVTTSLGAYQTEFSPVIPKTSDHILKLTFSITWDRYE